MFAEWLLGSAVQIRLSVRRGKEQTCMVEGHAMGKGLQQDRVLLRNGFQLLDVPSPAGVLVFFAAQVALLNVAQQPCHMLGCVAAALH